MTAPASSVELVGRERELEHVRAWRELIASGPAGLLIRGEPGIGKTTVWEAAVAAARDMGAHVLVTRPVEAELPLGYSGLGDLLAGASADVLEELAPVLADALGAALLVRDDSEAADPLAVARGALAALLTLAERSAVVVAVDDVQWLDVASVRALAFAVRRLGDARIGIAASLRDGYDDPLELARALSAQLLDVRLAGLSAGGIGHLLRARVDPELPRRAVMQVHARSGGNPFFALELARSGGELPPSMREVVDERLSRLSPEAASAVELAAVLSPAPPDAFDADSLDAGVAAGVLVEQGGLVRFSHPLLAAGAYDRLPPGRRRELHRCAADLAHRLEERARHIALATNGPDEPAAALLEEAARAARARGAPGSAAELAAHARRLTAAADSVALARRTMDEADCLFLAADEPAARRLVDEVLTSGARGVTRVRALVQRALHELEPAVAVARLEEAAREPHEDRQLTLRALSELAWMRGAWLGDVELALAEAMGAVKLAEEVADAGTLVTALTTAGLIGSLAGDPAAEQHFRRAIEIADRVRLTPGDRAPRSAFAHHCWWRGDWSTAEALLAREREEAERVGDERMLLRLGIFEAELAARRGRWDDAERLLDDALADTSDYWYVLALVRRAVVRAHRGQPEALVDAEEVAAAPAASSDPLIAAWAEHAAGLLDLAAGRSEAAADQMTRLTDSLQGAGARAPEIEAAIPGTVVALVGSGRLDEADALTRHLEQRRDRTADAWAVPAAQLCRGLVLLGQGDTPAALERLARARTGFGAVDAPWELAQTLLAEGHGLRRAGRRTDAAAAFERAAALFSELRTQPWRDRAVEELRRARPRPRRDDSLTAAESRVAALVAAGHRNREVAAQLFTTVATVEAHLTRIYRKLGLRSRTELTRAVTEGRVELDA